MGINGTMEQCHRCESTVFRKHVGTGEADGGWSRWDKFEPFPDGWLYVGGVGNLCPYCAEQFKETMTNFFGRDKVPNDWRSIQEL